MNPFASLAVNSRFLALFAVIVAVAPPLLFAGYYDVVITGATSGGPVWGSGPYTANSDLPKAAVHAGLVAVGQTRILRITERYPGSQTSFMGSTQNGVTTLSCGAYPDSFDLSYAPAVNPPTASLSFDATSWLDGSTRQAARGMPLNVSAQGLDVDGNLQHLRIVTRIESGEYWDDFWSYSSPSWPNCTATKTMPIRSTTIQVRAEVWDATGRYGSSPWQSIDVVVPPGNQPPVAGLWAPSSARYGDTITLYCSAADAEGALAGWRLLRGWDTTPPLPWPAVHLIGGPFQVLPTIPEAISGQYRYEAFDRVVIDPNMWLDVIDVHGQAGRVLRSFTLDQTVGQRQSYTATHGRLVGGVSTVVGTVDTTPLNDQVLSNGLGFASPYAGGGGPWLEADLGVSRFVERVIVGNGNVGSWAGPYYCAGARLEWSTGNGIWNHIYTVPPATSPKEFNVYPNREARYWRLIKDTDYLVVSEFAFVTRQANTSTSLLVVEGTGGGAGAAGTIFDITANPVPPGHLFAGWVTESGAGLIANPTASLTQFTLGAGSAVVRATYAPNLAPTAAIEGPSSLRVGTEGVWTYTASDANGNLLNWSVRLLPAASNPTSISGSEQTSAFAHTFATAGTYTFRLEVTDAMGITTTVDKGVTALENVPPTVPGSVSATALSPTHFQFTWTASSDASGVSGYEVCLNDGLITAATGLTHLFEGLPAGSSHVAKVRAVDGAGNLSGWAQASVTLPANASGDTQAPTAPSLDVWGSDTTANLLFGGSTDNVGVTQYELRRDVQPVEVFNAQGGSIFHVVTGLANGTIYTFKVRAVDAAGNRSVWTSVPWTSSGSPPPPPNGAVTSSDYSALGASPWAPSDSSNASQLKTTRPKP